MYVCRRINSIKQNVGKFRNIYIDNIGNLSTFMYMYNFRNLPTIFVALSLSLYTYIYIYTYVCRRINSIKQNVGKFRKLYILCVSLSSTPYRQLENQAPNKTGSNHLYNTLELLMMGIMVPETCWARNKICNKNHLLHLAGILFPHINVDA